MRRALVGLMAVLILTVLVPLPPAAEAATTVTRAPIVISGNAALTAANGVVSGAGSSADPYVISGWLIDATSGPAISIRYTSKHIVVRDNVLSAPTLYQTIDLKDNSALVRVAANTVSHKAWGVLVQGGRTIVEGNAIRDVGSVSTWGAGVSARGGDVFVANNTLIGNDRAVLFQDARATAFQNVVPSGIDGFHVLGGTAQVAANTVTVTGRGVYAEQSATVSMTGGLFSRPSIGVQARQSVVSATSVRVEGATQYAALLEDGQASFDAPVVVGGAQGIHVHRGLASVSSGTFDSVVGIGVRYLDATGTASGNLLLRNGGGIGLDGGSVVAVTGNVMYSNTWGLGIAYPARASIALLSGNTVNGLSTADVYHYHEANINFASAVDSGYGAGYYGSLSREGLLVLYEVDGAFVEGASLSHGTVGVHAVNSFNVVVNGSELLSNLCGVLFNNTVGFVKNTTIDIPVDPPTTCGVNVIVGGFVGIFNNTILRVDVGVAASGNVKLNVTGNVIHDTYIAVSVTGGSANNVSIYANVLTRNVIGLELKGRFTGTVTANNITLNARAGVRVEGGLGATFRANVVVRNMRGLEDLTPCASSAALASRVFLYGNTFSNNTEFGMMINGTVVARGNVFADNGGDGAVVCGRIEGRFDVYARNGADGLEVRGSAQLEVEVATENRFGAGMRLQGTLFVVLMSNVTANFDGIITVELLPEIPPPPPVQIPVITIPSVNVPCVCLMHRPDPLWVHLSRIAFNSRYAISASAQTDVNATNNWWGNADGPDLFIPQVGEFGNVVSPNVRFVPWYRDSAMTDRALV
ncbi:MAG TPA: right-handed parallel beta-helix repeat-containing protein [Candidatus Thermoplasmatota archaeon]|nr:right-handed parallel beta-helix repeat-containing protein [Candidatus Thermoplasmatota archaeon]